MFSGWLDMSWKLEVRGEEGCRGLVLCYALPPVLIRWRGYRFRGAKGVGLGAGS